MAHDCRSGLMLWLLVGTPFQDKLSKVAIPFTIRPLRSWTGSFPADEADVLDAMLKTVLDHGIIPVDASRKAILLPHEPACIPFFGRLEDKANACLVALAFHTVQSTPMTLEAYPSGLPETDSIGSLIGTSRQFLSGIAIKMVSNPACSGTRGVGIETSFDNLYRKLAFSCVP